MSKKELELKIAKYLHKANRLKSTQAKLERIDELIDIIQRISPQSSTEKSSYPEETLQRDTDVGYLENYLELCYIHKLKFQMDVVFFRVKKEITRLKQNLDQINQDLFESLMYRLQTVLEIDADHPEAQELIRILHIIYKQQSQNFDYIELPLNIAQYKLPRLCIEIACNLQDIEAHHHLKTIYKQYEVTTPQKNRDSLCRMQFYLEHLKDFEIFHEELRVKPSYKIIVNNYDLDEQAFSDWFQCYKRFIKANNPQYCYGASPFTFNFFGCHKLSLQDVAKQLEKCWFHSGTLDQESGLFFVMERSITDHIRAHLNYCGFCPALTQKKLTLGMALLPKYINPECDNRWEYYYTHGERTGVIPSGNEIAISTLDSLLDEGRGMSSLEGDRGVSSPNGGKGVSPVDLSALIEVGSTPYIHKVLRYLESNNPSNLAEPAYRGLSTCMNCGAPYKPYTMTCSRCKIDFWKYAMKDIERALNHLRYFREIKPQFWDIETQNSEIEEDTVSFDQLWNDPQVQAILSQEQCTSQDNRKEQKIPTERGEDIPQTFSESPASYFPKSQMPSSDRLEFHEKLRSLVSKRYRERKAIEKAFSHPTHATKLPGSQEQEDIQKSPESHTELKRRADTKPEFSEQAALINAVKSLKPRKKSELSKRGVVRIIYHATIDKETCPLCSYLDGMVMDPDDPATDIFSPPLYPGCNCSREYVLKTEKPKNWPRVTFKFPPDELLIYLDKKN